MIEAQGLTKRYWVARHRRGAVGAVRSLFERSGREVLAVSDMSFRVTAGEIVGYVGPNGAGKSTTIKMLTGILVPSGGEAMVAGLVPWRQRKQLARRIGVVFGQRTQLWWDLPLIESLELLRYVYQVPAARFAANLSELADLLELAPFLETPVRQLSLGQRMRGDLAAAMLHEPSLLYLDEPTIGLDVVAKARVRDFLQRVNAERGVTILLTTHDMADVEHLCRRMLIIDHGRLLYDGAVTTLRERYGASRTLVVDLEPGATLDGPAPAGVGFEPPVGDRYRLRFERAAIAAADLVAWVAARAPIRDLTIEEPAIETIIRQIYEGDLLRSMPEEATRARAD